MSKIFSLSYDYVFLKIKVYPDVFDEITEHIVSQTETYKVLLGNDVERKYLEEILGYGTLQDCRTDYYKIYNYAKEGVMV